MDLTNIQGQILLYNLMEQSCKLDIDEFLTY